MNARLGLTPNQIHEVTGFRRASKQIQALVIMDIPFKVRLDGSPFVARSAISDPEGKAPVKPEAVLNLN